MIPRLCGRAALGFALLSALCGGCQTVETRHAPDPYYEYAGAWCGNYGIDFAGARVAVLNTLSDLKMPVFQEGPGVRGIFLDTRTPENLEARVLLVSLGGHEGTRICVRVGGFGTHREVCERLLDEFARHVNAPRESLAVPPVPGLPPPVSRPGSPAAASPVPGPSLPPQPVPVAERR